MTANTATVSLLKNVVAAARAAATGSASLTATGCAALLGGVDVLDVIAAIDCGYQEAGQEMPAGTASNWKRLAAAGAAIITRVSNAGVTLNNRVLADVGAPKLSTAGRKPGKGKGKTTKPTAVVEPVKDAANWAEYYRTAVALQANCAKLACISSEDQFLMQDLMLKIQAVARRYMA